MDDLRQLEKARDEAKIKRQVIADGLVTYLKNTSNDPIIRDYVKDYDTTTAKIARLDDDIWRCIMDESEAVSHKEETNG